MADTTPTLRPAQNRGLRELYFAARQLVDHWSTLADRLPRGPATDMLRSGVRQVRDMLDELADVTARHGLHGWPAAQGVGMRLADVRNLVGDRTLERNQALRLAVLDVQHVVTLLAYLTRIAERQGPEDMATWLDPWWQQMLELEAEARAVAIAIGEDADAAIVPLDESKAGKIAYNAALQIGTLGEWFDRQAARRRST